MCEKTDKFADIARDCGATIHRAILLGKYLHIETNQESEQKLREILDIMKAKKVKVMEKGRDGKHLDGGRHHRLVAVF